VVPGIKPLKALFVGNSQPGESSRLRVVHEYGRLQRKLGFRLPVLLAFA
jgi:hypothetical protein